MGLFDSSNPKESSFDPTKAKEGFISRAVGKFSVDIIKYEPAGDEVRNIVAHKFEYEDFPNGSMLIVADSQMAVFVNNVEAGDSINTAGGAAQVSIFTGPCKIKLDTGDSRFAPFRNMAHKLTGGESAFHSTVYFINTAYQNDLNWGTQAPIMVTDPEVDLNVHVRAFGLYGVHLEQVDSSIAAVNARKFLKKVVGTKADYSFDELELFMRAKILEYVPDLLAKAMIEKNIGILKIAAHLTDFSDTIKERLREHFDDFGLCLDNFSFHSINAPDEDLQAITDLKIRKKEAEANAIGMDIESEALARKRAREGYTFQQEQAFNVMETAAGNEGSGSNMMNMGMGLGMGVGMGGAMGMGMANMAQQAFGGAGMIQPGMAHGMMQPGMAPGMQPGMSPYGQPPQPPVACPKCGTPAGPGERFCAACGTEIPAPAACPKCGKILKPGAAFCTGCGTKLGAPASCPNCGTPAEPGEAFCAKCGTKL
ncbi:MAG: SPFH domain-containing protein [Lachnospiraceae bacterium]|nr:SPFH domain-containing protein [Lachnospiraceae bacterium]